MHLDLLEVRQHIQLREVEVREAVDLDRKLECDHVQPPDAAGAPRGRAVLAADLPDLLAQVAKDLGRVGARADARRVGLGLGLGCV